MSSSKVVVTIEGSTTPCVVLPKGERRTVSMTPRIRKLIAKGYVTVVETKKVSVPPAKKKVDDAPSPYAHRSTWADFLDGKGVAYPEDATRTELAELWASRG